MTVSLVTSPSPAKTWIDPSKNPVVALSKNMAAFFEDAVLPQKALSGKQFAAVVVSPVWSLALTPLFFVLGIGILLASPLAHPSRLDLVLEPVGKAFLAMAGISLAFFLLSFFLIGWNLLKYAGHLVYQIAEISYVAGKTLLSSRPSSPTVSESDQDSPSPSPGAVDSLGPEYEALLSALQEPVPPSP